MLINYRKATLSDKKVLFDLGVKLNEFNLEHDLKENLFWEGWEKDIDKEIDVELHDPLFLTYLAETDDKIPAGYILIKNCIHCGHFEVDQLFVKDEFRGNKVGKGLMDLALEEAKKSGRPLLLEVYKSNAKAISFYEKLGFKESGVIMRIEPEDM